MTSCITFSCRFGILNHVKTSQSKYLSVFVWSPNVRQKPELKDRWLMGRMSVWSSARGLFEVFSPRWRSVLSRDAKWWCQSEFVGLRVELFNCQPDLETEPRLVALYRSLCLSVFLLGDIADRTTWYLHYMSSTSPRKRLAIWRYHLYTSIQDPQFKFTRMRLWFSTRCTDIFTLI